MGFRPPQGLLYRDSLEVLEQKYPILFDEVRVAPDSEGPEGSGEHLARLSRFSRQ